MGTPAQQGRVGLKGNNGGHPLRIRWPRNATLPGRTARLHQTNGRVRPLALGHSAWAVIDRLKGPS